MTSNPTTKRTGLLLRAAIAVVLLGGLVVVAGSSLAPHMPVQMVLLYSALGAAALLVLAVLVLVVSLTVRQFILRKGGTDVQWLWFPSDPKGLEQLRAQQRANEAAANDAHK